MSNLKTGNFFLLTALLFLNFQSVKAQISDFRQTGVIRPIVSETETQTPSWKHLINASGIGFVGTAKSKTEYYFVYKANENGVVNEKWIALSDKQDFSKFSNQTVRIEAESDGKTLSNASIKSLTQVAENEFLAAPPPTVGVYKITSVPLTIQPQNANGKPIENQSNLAVTPEQIRNTLFNAPNSVNNFYKEASYGKLEFAGVNHPQIDVVPVTIQATISGNCQDQIVTQFTPIVRQRLLEQNIDTNNGSVDLGLIIYNDVQGCPPYPFATRGALGQRGAPLWVWMPESWFVTGPSIIAHEMGHALGGNHPNFLRCTNFNDPQTCVSGEASDRNLMTAAGEFYLMPGNFERRRWGWHPNGAFDSPANQPIYSFDLKSSAYAYSKDSRKKGRFLYRNLGSNGVWIGWDIYPEGRRNIGLFENYRTIDAAFLLGASLRMGYSDYAHPEAFSMLIDTNNSAQIEDAPLRLNQQLSIGGAVIQCTREQHPGWGTRIKIQ